VGDTDCGQRKQCPNTDNRPEGFFEQPQDYLLRCILQIGQQPGLTLNRLVPHQYPDRLFCL